MMAERRRIQFRTLNDMHRFCIQAMVVFPVSFCLLRVLVGLGQVAAYVIVSQPAQ